MGRFLHILLFLFFGCLFAWSAVDAQVFNQEAAVHSYLSQHAKTCIVEGANCKIATWSIKRHLDYLLVIIPLMLIFFSGLAAKWQRRCERLSADPILQVLRYSVLIALVPWTISKIGLGLMEYFGGAAQSDAKLRGLDGVDRCLGSEGWVEKIFEFVAEGLLVWIGVCLILAVLIWVGRKCGKRTWLIAAAIWSGYFVYLSHNSDIFHSHGIPFSDGPLVEQVEKMAAAEQFPLSKIILADPKTGGDWYQGQVIGVYRPIIALGLAYRDRDRIFDHTTFNGTPLKSATDAMTAATVGHELAHVRKNHVFKTLVYIISIVFLLCWISYIAWTCVVKTSSGKRFEAELWSLSSLTLLAPIALISVSLMPYAQNPLVLHAEREADAIGLDISKEPDGFAALVVATNTGTSLRYNRWMQLFVFTHPSGEERIRTAMQWKARHKVTPSGVDPTSQK